MHPPRWKTSPSSQGDLGRPAGVLCKLGTSLRHCGCVSTGTSLGSSWFSRGGIVTALHLPEAIKVKARTMERQQIREAHLAAHVAAQKEKPTEMDGRNL